MHESIVLALRFLHILSASTWLGASVWAAGDVRRTLALGRPHTDALTARVRPALALDFWSGLATLATGVIYAGLLYGGAPPPGIMVGLVAVLLRLGLQVGVLMPASRRLQVALQGADAAAAAPLAKRMGMISGIGHLLWVIALAGMVWR